MDGVPSILLVRLQDIFITGALLVVALIWLGRGREAVDVAEGKLPQALLALVVAVLTAVVLGRVIARTSLVRRLAPTLLCIWSAIRVLDLRVWLATLAVGLLVRLVAIVSVSCLFLSVGVPLSPATVLLITTLYTLLPMLPVNVVAGIGVTEAYLVACLVATGIDRAVAVAASVQIHGLQLLTAALLAGAGLVQLQYQRARELPARPSADGAGRVAHEGQR
jgi:uncharacterized membrane protein YbhN (UPF0104 family)